jgi:GWxTD domain-containing protein
MMKKTAPLVLTGLFLLSVLGAAAGQDKQDVKGLDPRFQQWLEEDVLYIITPKERDVFLRLGSDKERDIFIEAFWKQRDPTPGTPRNEFRDEHFRRIAEATRLYGRGTPRPGWRTDMGRIFILLGPPDDVERFEGQNIVYPAQIWTYRGEELAGLPPRFHIVFFKDKGMGEYKLYSPNLHGMQSLLIDKNVAGGDPEQAYYELFRFDPELAQAALSLVPDEHPAPGDASLTSDILLANVIDLPRKKVDDEYAAKMLAYKDVVEVDYTANYIRSGHLVSLIRDERGVVSVHFSLEPTTLSLDNYRDKFLAHFEVNVKVSDAAGRTVFQYGKSFPLEVDEQALSRLQTGGCVIQDAFPLVPGSYTLDVIMKNTVSKEFSSFDQAIRVPGPEGEPEMSPLVLGYKSEKSPAGPNRTKPFVCGEEQVQAHSNRLFARGDALVVFFQVYRLKPDLARDGSVQLVLSGESGEWRRETFKLSDLPDPATILRSLPLNEAAPGFHRLRASILDAAGREILFEEKEFQVTPQPAVARPWILSKVMTLSRESLAEVDFILANQHWARGELVPAGELLEKCTRQFPRLRYAQRFAEFLLQRGDHRRVKDILAPFVGTDQEQWTWLAVLGRAEMALGEYEPAAGRFREYLVRSGASVEILNVLGECSFRLGDIGQALTAWKKSLELSPGQPELRKRVEDLEKR